MFKNGNQSLNRAVRTARNHPVQGLQVPTFNRKCVEMLKQACDDALRAE